MVRTKFPVKESQEPSITKKTRIRSPGYPMIDLKEAIEKIKILWKKDKTSPIPKDVAAKHLGYENAGGYGGRVIAALKHFDLISMREGDIILSEKAVDLVLHSPSDKIYIDIVKEIALKPNTYTDLYNEYKDLSVSDANLKAKLIKDYKFNAKKVDRFINNFRSTLEFAGLLEGKKEVEITRDEMARDIAKARVGSTLQPIGTLTLKPQGVVESFPIPLSEGKKAAIVFESLPVKKRDIKKIEEWIKLFKDSLTGTESEDTESENE